MLVGCRPGRKAPGVAARRSRVGTEPTITFQRGTADGKRRATWEELHALPIAPEVCRWWRSPSMERAACQPCGKRRPRLIVIACGGSSFLGQPVWLVLGRADCGY